VSAPFAATSVGVALLLLTLTGCSGPEPAGKSAVMIPVVTTPTAVDPVETHVAETTPTTVATGLPPATTNTSTTTTTVVTELAGDTEVASVGVPLEEMTTTELDDLLFDLDRVLADLESSLAQEEGEIFNE